MREFPKALYRVPGHVLVDGIGCALLIVKDAAEEAQAGLEGWHAGLPTSAEPAPAVAVPDAPAVPSRESLIAELERLGGKADGRWSDARLLREIEAAKA